MSRRYWIALAAIGLSAVASAQEANPEIPPSSEYESAAEQPAELNSAEYQEEVWVAPLVPESAPGSPVVVQETSESSEQAGPQERGFWWDTGAQWFMALFALAGVGLSGWAVWLLKETLAATHRTVTEAENATGAAWEAVAVTREVGQAQTRAYLSIQGIRCAVANTGQVGMAVEIQNSGQSPARNVKIRCGALPFMGNDERMPPRPFLENAMRPCMAFGVGDIPAGYTGWKPIEPGGNGVSATFLAAGNKPKKIIFLATLEYETVFENDEKTTRTYFTARTVKDGTEGLSQADMDAIVLPYQLDLTAVENDEER